MIIKLVSVSVSSTAMVTGDGRFWLCILQY